MWSLLILGTLPIVVMAWVPLMKLRPYIKNVREQVYRSNLQAWEQAVEGSLQQKELKAAWEAARKANIWPNGDFWGWLFLTLMIILAIAAFVPPALGYLLLGGGGILIFRFIWQLRPKN
jgi:Flp pilus assembly protein TadB